MRVRRLVAALSAWVALSSCAGGEDGERVHVATLQDGSYRVVGGAGFDPAEEGRLLAITARLDRAGGRLVFTLGGGAERALSFSPRPPERWQQDCYTMASHYVNEVADLSPAPLQLESLTFSAPVVRAMCGPRMILADGVGPEAPPWLALDPE